MQFAIINNQPIQATKDAPLTALCIICGEPVIKFGSVSMGFTWNHSDNQVANDCKKSQDVAQRKLDKALRL